MILVVAQIMAQKGKEKRYDKIFYLDVEKKQNDFTILVEKAYSNDAFTKFKLTITNTSTDYLIFNVNEVKINYNGKEFIPNERPLTIAPNSSEYRTIDVKGDFSRATKLIVTVSGLLKVKVSGKPIDMPKFRLPLSKNELVAGNFNLKVKRAVKKETDVLDIAFDVKYTGNKVGIIDPTKVALVMPTGKEFVNIKRNKVILLTNGNTEDFVLVWKDISVKEGDLQKVDVDIIWRDAFQEGSKENVPPVNLELSINEKESK